MKKSASTTADLRQENAELRARLAEAQETLDAIRTGAVDGVVVQNQVYTLHGAEEPYRLLIEAMNEGAVVLRADGTVLYCNHRFAELLGEPLQQVIGTPLRRFIVPDELSAFDALLAKGQKHSSKGEISLHCQGAAVVLVQLSFSVLDVQGAHGVCIVATDLTERKRAEDALKQSHETLEQRVIERTEELLKSNAALATAHRQIQSVIDNATAMIYVCDLEARFVMVNAPLAGLLQTTPAQMLGKRRHEFMPPADADKHEVNDRTVLAAGRAVEFEEQSELPGRSITWLSTKFPLRDAQGRIYAVAGIVTDITARKQAEEALRASEERHRLLAETMLQGVVHQDASGTIIAMNPAAERILGKTCDQFLGSSSTQEEHDTIRENGELFPGQEHPAMVALRTGQPVRGVVMGVFNPQRGERRWISIDAVPLFQPGATQPTEVYAVFEDITARKQAEEALRESLQVLERQRRLLGQTQEAAKVGGWELDLVTRQLYWTEETYRIHEVTPAAYTPALETALNFYAPESRPIIAAAVQAAMTEGKRWDLELELITATQRRIWVRANGNIQFADGRPIKIYGAFQDITERKHAEDKIKAALAEKEVLLKEIHHRVKNNLQVIASLVSLQTDGMADDRLQGEFDAVRDRVRAMALVHETLYQTKDLARLDFAAYSERLLHYLWEAHRGPARKRMTRT